LNLSLMYLYPFQTSRGCPLLLLVIIVVISKKHLL
jgi:hypothetical protein